MFGALITSVPSCNSETLILLKGVYHSEASTPLSFLRAICESVSVIPYVDQTA